MPKLTTPSLLVLTLALGTLAGCSSTPTAPVLNISAPSAKTSMMSVKSLNLKDKRANKSLSVINGVESPSDPQLSNKLQKWLNDSITINQNGRLNLDFNLLSYGSFIDQQTMQFTAESMMEWQVMITGENGYSWKKTYQTTINQEGPLKMGNDDIESHLNKMATKLLGITLNDGEFKGALSR